MNIENDYFISGWGFGNLYPNKSEILGVDFLYHNIIEHLRMHLRFATSKHSRPDLSFNKPTIVFSDIQRCIPNDFEYKAEYCIHPKNNDHSVCIQ